MKNTNDVDVTQQVVKRGPGRPCKLIPRPARWEALSEKPAPYQESEWFPSNRAAR
jgi:hypothetical protein